MEKYTDWYFTNLIVDKLTEADFIIMKVEHNTVFAERGPIDVQVTHERCGCHGGRLSIASNHTNFYTRLEYPDYREDLGIVDGNTELEYEIQHEMLPIINTIKQHVYCLKLKRGYHRDKFEHMYFRDVKDLSKMVLGTKDVDLFTLQDPYTETVPNPNIKYIITPTEFNGGIKSFEKVRFTRKDSNSEWEQDDDVDHYECYVFNKIKKSTK